MIKSELKEFAFQLFEEGTEPKEVLETLQEKGNVNRSTVYRWRNEFKEDQENSEEDSYDTQEDSLSPSSDSHKTHIEQDNTHLIQQRKKKRLVLKQSRRLLRELLELPSEGEFSKTDIEGYLSRFEKTQDEIEDALDYDSEVYQQNYLWNVVTDYVNKLERLKRVLGNDTESITFQDFLSLRNKLQLEIVLEVEELDEPYYLGMEFIGLEKSFLIELLRVLNQKTGVKVVAEHIEKLDKIISYATQNLLSDDFKDDLRILKTLKDELIALENNSIESRKVLFSISDSLFNDVLELARTTVPTNLTIHSVKKEKESWSFF